MPPKREGIEWESVTVLNENPLNSKNPRLQCNSCGHEFSGGASRIKGHILQTKNSGVSPCTKPVASLVTALKQIDSQKEREEAVKQGQKRAAEYSAISSSGSRDSKQCSIEDCRSTQCKADLDMLVSKFFFANGIAFNVARSPEWRDLVAGLSKGSYKAPGSEALRTTHLQKVGKHT